MKRLLFAFLALLLLLGPVRADTFKPAVLDGIGIDQRLGAQVPADLVFRDTSGKSVRLSELQTGRPIVMALVYLRCPSLCTITLNNLLSTLKVIPLDLGKDYDAWTVSFDPHETPVLAAQKKEEYVRAYQRTRFEGGASAVRDNAAAADSWHFLTGDEGPIHALTDAVGFRYRWDAAGQQFYHPAGILILSPDLKVSRYFFGVDYDSTDVRLALIEAGRGRIGSITDKALLFCYHYDPSTGKYGIAILRLLSIAAAFTVIVLASCIAYLLRADRRRTRALMPVPLSAQGPPGGGVAP